VRSWRPVSPGRKSREQAAALLGASPGQLQTQLHAGAAGGYMGDQARPLAPAAPADSAVPLPGVLEAVLRALAGALTTGGTLPAPSADPAVDKPLLDLEETAELLGVSRMTVARMADEGRLPSVVIRRGRVQKIRRIPRAFVDRIVADACAGAEVDLEEYTAAWLAERALANPKASTAFHRDEVT
jgi:excisionase family DNA binding protein